MSTIASAAHLMVGALFRSEVGRGTVDGGRRALSAQELGLAIGRVLGAAPVSTTLWGTPATDTTPHPDWSRADRTAGRFAAIRDRVADAGALAGLDLDAFGGEGIRGGTRRRRAAGRAVGLIFGCRTNLAGDRMYLCRRATLLRDPKGAVARAVVGVVVG